MHKRSIKWLSEIKKKKKKRKRKEKGVPHMLAPSRRSLDYPSIYCDVTERWVLAWNQNKQIMYFIY